MIKHTGKAAVLLLIAVFMFASLSYAQDQQTARQGAQQVAGKGAADNVRKQLNITAEQEAKLKAFRETRQKDAQAFREKMTKMQAELRALRNDPKADPKKVEGLIDEVYKLRAFREKDMFRNRNEMSKIFTPEQLEKMKQARGRLQRLGAFMGRGGRQGFNAGGLFMGRGMMGQGLFMGRSGLGLGFQSGRGMARQLRLGRLGMMLQRRFGNRMRWDW